MAEEPRFDVRLHPTVDAEIRRWNLGTALLVDVYLQLKDVLPESPLDHLIRDREAPERGAFFPFQLREDPLRFARAWRAGIRRSWPTNTCAGFVHADVALL